MLNPSAKMRRCLPVVREGHDAKRRLGTTGRVGLRGLPRLGALLAVLIVSIAAGAPRATGATGDEPQNPAAGRQVLHLTNGDELAGVLQDTPRPNVVRWQSPGFAKPFEFPVSAIASVEFPSPAKPLKPVGNYYFELAGGDVLFGTLVSLDPEAAELDVSPFGRLHVKRSAMRRLCRWRDGADLLYVGPIGLTGWRQENPDKPWREDAGQLVADREDASLVGDFGLPARAAVEFELSWKGRPDFKLTLGVDPQGRSGEQAFNFEVWENKLLVVTREIGTLGDVGLVQKFEPDPGRIKLQAFIDQEQGKAFVCGPQGQTLAQVEVKPDTPVVLSGIRLTNKRGDVRLERLRIGRWDGQPPVQVKDDKSRIHKGDGTIGYGQVKRFDGAAQQFVIQTDTGESRLDAKTIQSVVLSAAADVPPRLASVVHQDGTQLSGDLLKIENQTLWMQTPGIQEPLGCPLGSLHSLMVLRPSERPATPQARAGRLESAAGKFHGELANDSDLTAAQRLAWKPFGAESAASFLRDFSGRIVYRDPPAPKPPVTRQPPNRAFNRNAPIVAGNNDPSARVVRIRRKNAQKSLYLRTGDSIPCEVLRIDERGVTYQSPVTEASFVAHDQVKAVELADEADSGALSELKKQRLLMLPRMQRDNPPTQLICSTNGDFLRGRLIEMNDKKLIVEVRLENKELARSRVSSIIWLHADELGDAQAPAARSDESDKLRVQALQGDERRLTFLAEQLTGGALTGTSLLLGACRVDLEKMDQLLIGSAIEASASQLVYHQWKLAHAADPKFVTGGEGGEGSADAGLESALVGKAAPEFDLGLLDGGRFRLAEQKGKVIVLEFFATWCGPCMQALPQVDGVAREFKDRAVQFVAVNQQETPEKITAALERLQVGPAVALDRDGKVGDRFGATAIPQIVVIDGTGSVARVFLGASPHLADELRAALEKVLAPPKEPVPPAE